MRPATRPGGCDDVSERRWPGVDSDAAAERARAAAAGRRVSLDPLPELTGDLRITGPWAQVAWIHRVVDTWARSRLAGSRDGHPHDVQHGHPGVPGLDALRVDGFTEAARLLAVSMGLAGAPTSGDAATVAAVADHLERTGRVVVAPDGPAGRRRSWSQAVVVLPVASALGLADDPGHVPGYGPVPAVVARELLATADTWRVFLTDTAGRLVDVSRHCYRPTARMRELVTARDGTCTFPGCARPAVDCELDHDTPFDGDNTTAGNLRPRCTGHHRLKHARRLGERHGRRTAGQHRVDQPERSPARRSRRSALALAGPAAPRGRRLAPPSGRLTPSRG